MLLAQYWRSFQNCAIFDCECGAVLDDLRHDDRRGGEKLMNCQRSDVLALRMLVRPVKMNAGPVLDRPLPAKSGLIKPCLSLPPTEASRSLGKPRRFKITARQPLDIRSFFLEYLPK